MMRDDSPYRDDDERACVHISILNSNFVHDIGEMSMKMEDLAEVASTHKYHLTAVVRENFMREQIWQVDLFQ